MTAIGMRPRARLNWESVMQLKRRGFLAALAMPQGNRGEALLARQQRMRIDALAQ